MTYPQLELATYEGPRVTLHTTLGDITIAMFPEQAPKSVANFIGLAKKGYYDGIIFHRVIKDFMIQGGDPTGTGAGGESIYGGSFEDEFSNQVFNLRGALSMANAGPNTNGSQFFIVQNKNINGGFIEQMEAAGYPAEIVAAYKQGGTPWLDHRHSVFGQVEKGMDVVDAIANVKTLPGDKPAEDVVIKSIDVQD